MCAEGVELVSVREAEVKDERGSRSSKFQEYPAKTLETLLEKLEESLPGTIEKDSYLMISGTGGMRTLLPKDSELIYSEAMEHAKILGYTNLVPFKNLSGDDEAKFAWISANYGTGLLSPGQVSNPILEIGGSSIQFTYAVSPSTGWAGTGT
jgi:hypothetical protein